MKVFYAAMKDDYGDPSRGPSFEEMNFKSALAGMGHDVVHYDFVARDRAIGRRAMREEIVAAAAEAQPDVVVFFHFERELSPDTLRAVGRAAGAPTVNWFADDHWRFDIFTRHMAPVLDWSVTTDAESVPKYKALGYANVILSQWACNRYAYGPTDGPLEHSVTFVGQPHADRAEAIEAVRDAGIEVECWGNGWPNGKLDHDDMVRVFGTSAVNLNLANPNRPPNTLRVRVGRLLGRGPKGPARNQIKGRTFEVPGCGGFELTERVPQIERYFELGREIAVYDDVPGMIDQIRHWLAHPDERAAVAQAGYRRVMAEHTYDHRFQEIFDRMGVA
jgi:spore maturation protein CgeB